MKTAKTAVLLTIACLLLAAVHPVDAAPNLNRPQARARAGVGGGPVSGQVVSSTQTPVAGAHVHIVHKKHAKKNPQAGAVKHVAKLAGAVHKHPKRHAVLTAADGSFTLPHVRAGTHEVEAHKKHVGSGHATVTVGANGGAATVMIRLHKHHHHHA